MLRASMCNWSQRSCAWTYWACILIPICKYSLFQMEYLALVDTLDLKSHHSYFVTYYESKDENGDITFHGTIKNKLIKDF